MSDTPQVDRRLLIRLIDIPNQGADEPAFRDFRVAMLNSRAFDVGDVLNGGCYGPGELYHVDGVTPEGVVAWKKFLNSIKMDNNPTMSIKDWHEVEKDPNTSPDRYEIDLMMGKADPRLLIRLDQLTGMSRTFKKAFSTPLSNYCVGDVLNKIYRSPEDMLKVDDVGVMALGNFEDYLKRLGLKYEPTMDADAWDQVRARNELLTDRGEINCLIEAQTQRERAIREQEAAARRHALAAERAEVEQREQARIADVQNMFTDAQKALLQPQTIYVKDEIVASYVRQIPDGEIADDQLAQANHKDAAVEKFKKLAVALAIVNGDCPPFVVLVSTGQNGYKKVGGIVCKAIEENAKHLNLSCGPYAFSWEERKSEVLSEPRKWFVFKPGNQELYDDANNTYAMVHDPKVIADLGLGPKPPTIVVGSAKVEAPKNDK